METITTGKRLKALREDRGLSQSQLAKKADINSRVLQTYEQDDRDIAGGEAENAPQGLRRSGVPARGHRHRRRDAGADRGIQQAMTTKGGQPAALFFYFTEGSPWGNTSAT